VALATDAPLGAFGQRSDQNNTRTEAAVRAELKRQAFGEPLEFSKLKFWLIYQICLLTLMELQALRMVSKQAIDLPQGVNGFDMLDVLKLLHYLLMLGGSTLRQVTTSTALE
jgi:hypothetical protein